MAPGDTSAIPPIEIFNEEFHATEHLRTEGPPVDGDLFAMECGADTRLVVYGTLAPGESNHYVVEEMHGTWLEGTVHGHRFEGVWRGNDGYPAFVLDEAGAAEEVVVFVSDDLPECWVVLDDFEGPGYRRCLTWVFDMEPEPVLAYIYEAHPPQIPES
jgi:gamma-glutamylcyclotransferase (GGCT)/AIG2-like uncharacterized protein YtfP